VDFGRVCVCLAHLYVSEAPYNMPKEACERGVYNTYTLTHTHTPTRRTCVARLFTHTNAHTHTLLYSAPASRMVSRCLTARRYRARSCSSCRAKRPQHVKKKSMSKDVTEHVERRNTGLYSCTTAHTCSAKARPEAAPSSSSSSCCVSAYLRYLRK
jgi:hypothetical protein